jgi:hypothetical protein
MPRGRRKWKLHCLRIIEMKARDYMALYNLIQNVDEDKKDPFEKVGSSRKLVKKKRTHRTVGFGKINLIKSL